MKRIFALALAIALLLCGCGNSGDNKDKGDDTTATATVKLGEVTLTVGDALTADQKTALGEPAAVSEAPSCHYEGMDTVYAYDGYSLQTYRKNNADILCVVTIEDAAYPTAKGVKVGDTLEAVRTAYGEPTESTNYYWVYNLTDTVTLTFELDGDTVAIILYEQAA